MQKRKNISTLPVIEDPLNNHPASYLATILTELPPTLYVWTPSEFNALVNEVTYNL
jgi:hypothetical protein